MIINGAKEENERSWKEMRNLYINICRDHAKKRTKNAVLVQNVEKSFIRRVI
jgi:hypothetical protein